MSSTVKYTTCPLCEANCGIEVHVEGDKIEKITGDKNDPISQGYMCIKAKSLKELYEDKDRLRQPMIREGKTWKTVSWDEALDFAADGISTIQKKYGKDAFAVFQGNPIGHSADGIWYYWLFTKLLDTKNIFSSASLDQLPHMMVTDELYGNLGMFTIPDVDRTDYMVIIGANPIVSNGSIMSAPNIGKRLKDIQKRGGKIVVIDPRKTKTAKIADTYLDIIPGTDVYFLLALLNVLFTEGLIKIGRLKSRIDGVDQLEKIVENYTPESVSEITGIDANAIRTLALEFSKAKSATLYPRVGASTQKYGTLTHWLCHVIVILTGNLDKEGGMMLTKPAIDFIKATYFLGESGKYGENQSRVKNLKSFRGEFPTATLLDELETPGDGQIKGMLTAAGNPVLSSPNGKKLGEALEKLEFMVSIDIYKNETTRHAHVILPPSFALENVRFEAAFPIVSVRNKIKYSSSIFDNGGDSKSDGDILKELNKRIKRNPLRLTTLLSYVPFEFIIDLMLNTGFYGSKYMPLSKGINFEKVKKEKHGIDLGPLTPMLPNRIFNKKKRINLASKSFIKEVEKLEIKPKNSNSNTFLMIGRRQIRTNNSWYHNLPDLTTDKVSCELFINSRDAIKKNITDGQIVTVETNCGSVRVPVKITDDIREGVVSLPHGWGHNDSQTQLDHAKKNPGVSINDLIDNNLIDELSGTSVFNGIEVEIKT